MKRTINSTGRKRIPQGLVTVRLNEPPGGPRSFSVHFGDLSGFGLAPDGHIYVEPYVATSSARFSYGTVASVSTPAETLLTELDEGAAILFRVKVVDETGDVGKILASADGITPRAKDDADGRKPLLPIRHTDLGEELWQLEIDRDAGPMLCVNNRVPGLADRVTSDPLVQGLILPIVLRTIIGELFEADDDADWTEDWRAFCSRLSGLEIDWNLTRDDDELEVDELVRRIALKFVDGGRYTSRARAVIGGHSGD